MAVVKTYSGKHAYVLKAETVMPNAVSINKKALSNIYPREMHNFLYWEKLTKTPANLKISSSHSIRFNWFVLTPYYTRWLHSMQLVAATRMISCSYQLPISPGNPFLF